jgi:hypothetical protein
LTQWRPKHYNNVGSILHCGANENGPTGYQGRSALLLFPLGALGYQERLDELILSVVLFDNIPITGVDADVWFTGVVMGDPRISHLQSRTPVYEDEILLKASWLTGASPKNTPIYLAGADTEPARAAILDWYRRSPDYAGAGAYACFRINPSDNPGSVTAGWFIYSGNVANDLLKPKLRLWVNPRDKPLVYITISGGIYLLDTGLDGPYWGNYDTTFTR